MLNLGRAVVVLPKCLIVCTLTMAAAFLWPAASTSAQDSAAQAQQTFQSLCIACHTVGGGRLIGPDLAGVNERRDEDWLISFVQHSQQMVLAGDSIGMALFEEHGRVPMPDNPYSADQVRAILAYIGELEASGTAPVAVAAVEPATAEQILLGQDLFQGYARLANAGPTCTSCHEVTNDAVIGGGILAAELTTVFSRLGGPGVRAILGSPPFPVMQRAYSDRPLTEAEVVALVGFLEQADADQSLYQPRDYGIQLFGAGVVGTLLLLILCSLFWRGRKRGSVNELIYKRQVKST